MPVPVPPDDAPAPAGNAAPARWAPGARDSRIPPRWLPRALFMTVVAAFAAILVWRAASMLGTVITIIVISWFAALALEPMILWLGRRGIKRPLATGISMIGTLVVGIGVLVMLGGVFVDQLVELVQSIPGYYADLRVWLDEQFDVTVPPTDELLSNAGNYVGDIAPGVIGVGTSIAGGLFTATAVLLVVYYMASAGPKFRAAVLRYLAPHRQREVLRLWEVSQEKVAGFITSRIVLAAISTATTWLFLMLLGIPYALPLAVFTGLVSQFIPTVGTYIGGALPVLLALTVSPLRALAVLAFIIAYQQVENLVLTPKVSQRSLELNPAVAFLSVLAFGAVFGPLGAFLSLPVAATIQAVMNTYLRRHELVDPSLLEEEVVRRKQHDRTEANETDAADEADDASAPGATPGA
ncbi:AI-2E family transporter [Cellulomonas triticagri]|uniref:AI-2E family transporter n=1 Tax=Cellulomonas triticagri TaxID=2483352 RepID=A0A3M2IZ23_9CELL|nr:AI-2E family transporter [Cellulomonas triticagri]RMI05051.1 AI-2E family transporter [Cellulomonas triticagri]